jgi:hypothetical protein
MPGMMVAVMSEFIVMVEVDAGVELKLAPATETYPPVPAAPAGPDTPE